MTRTTVGGPNDLGGSVTSTSGTCRFLGRSLVSWASKKQNSVAFLPPKPSTLPQAIVAHNYFG
jgi:hypothetical protein